MKRFIAKVLSPFFNMSMQEFSVLLRRYKITFDTPNKIVVSAIDNNYSTCGLADRFRGMISAYACAKALDIPFRIVHTNPFSLSDFLVPNHYDWLPQDKEVSDSIFHVKPIVRMNSDNSNIIQALKSNKQLHLFSNVDLLPQINKYFKTSYSYHQLFNELFKPSGNLMAEVERYSINEKYISVSFRFTQLLGDFRDVVGTELDYQGQQALIIRSHEVIKKLYDRHNALYKVLVTSDSQKFIDSLTDIPYVFTLPGKIGHIGHCSDDAAYTKTFLDFYMISQAQKVYMAYSDKMWKSNFSKSAAETTGVEFESVEY